MNEAAKFEVYKKKLQGICDEHNLVYTFKKDRYPITLTVQTTGGVGGQMSMLENVEEEGYRSPDARLIFSYEDGEIDIKTSETFTISESLFSKLKMLFKNMHFYWLQFFFRDIIEREKLPAQRLPFIDDDGNEDDGGDIIDEAFSELDDDMGPLGSFKDDEDEEAAPAQDGEPGGMDGYLYDSPEEGDGSDDKA